jgi:hypothetical protein
MISILVIIVAKYLPLQEILRFIEKTHSYTASGNCNPKLIKKSIQTSMLYLLK